MRKRISVEQAQARLPELVGRAASSAEPCFIHRDGEIIAVLVGWNVWRRKSSDGKNSIQADRLRAYQERLKQLGPEYWLSAPELARLKELVDQEDAGQPLARAARSQLRRLLRRHEQLLVKRAAALQLRL